MHTNDNSSWWNQQTAMWLKSIVHQKTELLSSQDVDTLKLLEMIWGKMAKIIDFDFTNDSVVESISQYYNANNEEIFSLFDNADDALEFFNIFRVVKAWLMFNELKQSKQHYPVEIQGLIYFLLKLVEDFPTIFHHESPSLLEAVLICIWDAVKDKKVSFEVLMKFYKIIHILEKYQYSYAGILENSIKGNNRAEGKQKTVQQRLHCFKEFENFYEQKHTTDCKVTKHQAARMFFVEKTKEAEKRGLALPWKNAETFYKSYCNRKQSSSKNRKREEEKSELIAPYTLPKIVSDTLKNWLSASEQFSTEEFSENKA